MKNVAVVVVDVPFPMDNLHSSVWIRITFTAGASEKVYLNYLSWEVVRMCEWNVPGCGILRQNYAGNVPAAVPWETSVVLGMEIWASPFTLHRAIRLMKQRYKLLGNKSWPLCTSGCEVTKGCPLESKGENGIFLTGTGIRSADSTRLPEFQLPVISVGITNPLDWYFSCFQLDKTFHLW